MQVSSNAVGSRSCSANLDLGYGEFRNGGARVARIPSAVATRIFRPWGATNRTPGPFLGSTEIERLRNQRRSSATMTELTSFHEWAESFFGGLRSQQPRIRRTMSTSRTSIKIAQRGQLAARWRKEAALTLLTLLVGAGCSAQHGEGQALEGDTAVPPPGSPAYVDAVQGLKRSAENDAEFARGLARLSGAEPALRVEEKAVGKQLQALNDPDGVLNTVTDVPVLETFIRDVAPARGETVTVRLDLLSDYTDTMLGVLRWKTPQRAAAPQAAPKSQASFDVLAFNDDTPALGLGSEVHFVADGVSRYTVIAMPYSEDLDGAARLEITGCATCNTSEQVPIVGHVQHAVKGNQFETVAAPGDSGLDPVLMAFRLFPDVDDVEQRQLAGFGVSNDDGELGNTNYLSKIKTGMRLTGNFTDVLLTRAYGSTSELKKVSVVWKQDSTPISGIPTRPQNATCVAPTNEAAIPATLEGTGCFVKNGTNLTDKYVSGVIPYDVAHAFWSDGVIKERALALPNNTSITVDANGKWQLPVGAVMIKNFRSSGALFETRFVAQTASGPIAYSYKWENSPRRGVRIDTASPAATTVLNDAISSNYTWTFPRSNDCKNCHHQASGNFFLGLKSSQFNIDAPYSTGLVANQITTLKSLNMLQGPGVTANKFDHALPPRADNPAGDTSSLEQGRALLDVNCSYCHNAQRMPSLWKAEFSKAASAMDACDNVLTPGDAASSFLYERANTRGSLAMPPLATKLVDTSSMQRLAEWIDELDACGTNDVAIRSATSRWLCLTGDLVGHRAILDDCDDSSALQQYKLVDEGNGFVSLRPAASPTSCVQYNVSSNTVELVACGTTHWRQAMAPGGTFELRAQANDNLCLTQDTDGILKPMKCIEAYSNQDTWLEQTFYVIND